MVYGEVDEVGYKKFHECKDKLVFFGSIFDSDEKVLQRYSRKNDLKLENIKQGAEANYFPECVTINWLATYTKKSVVS